INANPNFVNENDLDGADNIWGTADDGLQLQPNSPSINSGTNTGATATDLAGNTRIQNTTIDMGPYEKGINQWTGAISTDWETTGNWSNNALPTNTEEAYIVTAANQPTVTTGAALNVSVAAGATLTISGTLSCAGAINNAGTIAATTGTVVLNGTTLQTLSGGVFSNNTLANLTVNNAAGVLLTDTLKITGTVNPQNGTLNTGNKLVLVSTLSVSGKILQIQPAADVTGNVTIQRYMIGGAITQRGWRSMSSPISNFNYTQLVDDIFVTGPGGSANGFDRSGTPSSIIHYQESTTGTRGWKDIANITATQDAGKGSMVFFRGDRTQTASILNTSVVPNNVTMAYYGNINKGNIGALPLSYTNTATPADDGWNLMGNPYPCPINYGAINKTGNVSNSFWVLNPNTGNYVNLIATDDVAISQGFFIQVNDVNQHISFEEADKVNTSPTQYFKTVANPFAIKMYSDSIRYDVAWLSFESTASKNYVFNQDALKFTNNLINLGLITADGKLVQRNVSQTLNANSTDTFVLSTQAVSNGNYWLTFEQTASLPATKNAFLVDLFTNNWINIKTTPSYSYTINNSTPASFGKRFLLILTDQHTSLPLSLLSFTGTKQQRNAQLNWSTASEKNSSHFVVQKSTDNVNWQNIGTVKAKGNSSITNNYSLTDFNAFTNQYLSNPNSQIPTLKSQLLTIYYRLQMVDKDNGHAYSHAIVLTDDMPQAGIALMPNPASNNVQIHINSLAQLLDVKVFDAKGAEATIALQGLQMDVSYLAAGVYMVQVLTTQGTQHIKLIKQ
ncbi:MAG: T9SS type A sorting domain-containing protein, partial [Bacteroidia bacterium]|nr:T9SS type A sorting domain-containing protein [Bacteroidia bacterium]